MNRPTKVGLIGAYDANLRHHIATNEALIHAADALSASVETYWIPTESLANGSIDKTLEQYDALWCAPCKSLQEYGRCCFGLSALPGKGDRRCLEPEADSSMLW